MTTSDENNIPVGLYVLSVLMIVPALVILYSAIKTEISIYIAVISVPLFTYAGIGIISRWPRAKDFYTVVAVLLFLGAIPDLVIGFISEETTAIPNGIDISETIMQFTIFPIAYFYFNKENVKSYLNQPANPRFNLGSKHLPPCA